MVNDQSTMTREERVAAFNEAMFAKKPPAMAAWALAEMVKCGYCFTPQPITMMKKYTNHRRGGRVNFYCDYVHLRNGELMYNAIDEYGSLGALLSDAELDEGDVTEKGKTLVTLTGDFAVCKYCGDPFPIAKEGRKREFCKPVHRVYYSRAMKAREVIEFAAKAIQEEQDAAEKAMEAEIAANEAMDRAQESETPIVIEFRNDEIEPEPEVTRHGRKPKVWLTEPMLNGTYIFQAGQTFATPVAARLSFPKIRGWRWRCVCGAKAGSMEPFPSKERANLSWQLHLFSINHRNGVSRRVERKLAPATLHRARAAQVTR